MTIFYTGLHQPSDAAHFPRCCINVNRVRKRLKRVNCPDVIIDSGAFSEISTFGDYRHAPEVYGETLIRLARHNVVSISAAVSQDYMCEPFILAKTGLTIAKHQTLSVMRYERLLACAVGIYIMPVLQGYTPEQYVSHIKEYGDLLRHRAWVGVGSVCKRQGNPVALLKVLRAIKEERPDLRLHGFGVKTTALTVPQIVNLLYSADSTAWSYRARIEGRNQNDWREADSFRRAVEAKIAVAQQRNMM